MSNNIHPTQDEYFMGVCRTVAKRDACDRGRSGCVIARDNQILVMGYMGSPAGLPYYMRTVHAEQNAIYQAAEQGISIDDATVYVKRLPCRACAIMLINCGIKRIVCEYHYHNGADSIKMLCAAGIKVECFNSETKTYEDM